MVVMFLSVTVVTFIIFFVIPSEDDQASLGRGGTDVDVRTTVQIDGPIYEEYAEFLQKIVTQGSLGNSWVLRGQEVNELIVRAAPVTLSLVIGGAILWMLIAIPTGLLSALHPRSLGSRLTTVLVLIGISAHPLWMGLMLSYLVGARLGWTPTGGYCEVFSPAANCGGPAQWAYHLILPWFTFALMYAAIYTRMIRASTLETLDEDYVRTARAKGLRESRVILRHVLRNSILPVMTLSALQLGFLISGSVVTERVFSLPGLGRFVVDAIFQRDYIVVQTLVLFFGLAYMLINLATDIAYAVVDPRIRYR
jgi:peptide/nickel transport system permease protein